MIWDFLSALAVISTTIIAFVALLFAKKQISSNEVVSARSTATQIYNEQLRLALAYPNLSFPLLGGGFQFIRSDENQLACYHWFMAAILHSCEEILAVTKGDPWWEKSVYAMLQNHKDYLVFRNDLDTFYSVDLLSVVLTIINADGPTDIGQKYASRAFAEPSDA